MKYEIHSINLNAKNYSTYPFWQSGHSRSVGQIIHNYLSQQAQAPLVNPNVSWLLYCYVVVIQDRAGVSDKYLSEYYIYQVCFPGGSKQPARSFRNQPTAPLQPTNRLNHRHAMDYQATNQQLPASALSGVTSRVREILML